jgi:signal peptidase I
MKKKLFNWLLPIFISIGLVFLCRLFFFGVITVSDSNMEYTLKMGDKLLFSKVSVPERNKIVITGEFGTNPKKNIFRVIGMPGDSVLISNSIVYINNAKIQEEKGVSYIYTFKADSQKYVFDLLRENKVNYDKMLVGLGLYRIQADITLLKKLKSNKLINTIKREIEEKSINTGTIMASEYSIYWNKDHLGPVLVPYKGLTIDLDIKSFILYKELIQNETGHQLTNKTGNFYLDSNPIKSYSFKTNYFFLMNDNRSDAFDSRILGLVPENKIKGVFILKLP